MKKQERTHRFKKSYPCHYKIQKRQSVDFHTASDFPAVQRMLLENVTSMRLLEVKVQQPKDHEMIFSQKDVITLTAELTAHSSVLRISQRHYKATNAITCPGNNIYSEWLLTEYVPLWTIKL